jgi:hypothetical protein
MSIVDTKLINCNRITSIEANSANNSNPAYFTNQLDETLILNVGDQISIERSFISEVGAGNSQVIEFKGATLKEGQTIPYTKITPSEIRNDPFDANYRMGYYQVYEASEEEHTYDLKDNEAYIRYGYYINADDHPYYISLPRRFITDNVDTVDDETRFTDRDETSQGMTHFSVQPDNFAVCDYYRYKTKDNKIIPKLKIDGSRYALYVLETTSFNNTTGKGDDMMPYTPATNASLYRDHTALNTWYPYNEIKKISIKEGFNTSSEIADQISNQLNESETPLPFNIGYEVSGERYLRTITTTVEAPTYRLFNCANIMSMNASNFDEYINASIDGGQPSTNSQLYYSSYQYIGVKRPELWQTGRAIVGQNQPRQQINPNSTITRFSVLRGNRQTSSIITMFEWSKTTLEQISAFLKAQELYPELFENLNSFTTYNQNPLITNTRYIHINKWGASSGSVDTGTTYNNALGADGYLPSNECLSSIPLFIGYRKDEEDLYYDVDDIPVDKYAFGFATPYYDPSDKKYYVEIHPETNGIGGIPEQLFNEPNITTGNLEAGRPIGYDPHFTAYGTACVLLNSGAYIFNPLNPVSEQKIQQKPATTFEKTAKYFTQRYVGANNPVCQFNQDTNRYEFVQLHEALNVGNDKLAGDTGNSPVIPESADAGDVVYKFNPRIQSFGFSPNFKPYLKPKQVQLNYPSLPKSNVPASDTETNKRAFDELNENIQPYALFDSRSGIYIDNWGVDSENWEASLWGTMGFSYEQFHATLTKNNTLNKRIDNLNYQSLKFLTTNSEQATTDTKAWVSNAFNAPMYELGLAQGRTLITYQPTGAGPDAAIWEPLAELEIIPAIINKTESMSIPSVNLSKSMIRPYYTIRSNIIEDTTSNVNGALLPIVSVVDKYSAQGDFYFGNPSSITFTITKTTYISSITTSIHDPDGKFANVNNSSAIIYKINKQRPPPPNILEEILKEDKENKKK